MNNLQIYLKVVNVTEKKLDQCTRCVMDTSDEQITFNSEGVCNHCSEFDSITSLRWFPNEQGASKLNIAIEKIKAEGKGKDYDCIIGLSGGIDSSYLAVKLKDYGLRPLVVHVDAGWNSELAVYNIEQVVKYCGFDLHTHVMDWEEIKSLQVAYLKSGVANQDVVQDHAYFSSLYHFAVKNGIKTVISGGNISTEAIFPSSWHHSAMDARNIHAINKKFGKANLKSYKTINILQYYLFYPYMYKMKTLRPLNFMEYNKDDAMRFLIEEVGYKEYGRKHGESIFTKFFQNYYLPEKFGYDKRKPHLASLINTGQISRADALIELNKPLYETKELEGDIEYVAKKLELDVSELMLYINSPGNKYSTYKNWDTSYHFLKKIQLRVEKILGKEIKNYA